MGVFQAPDQSRGRQLGYSWELGKGAKLIYHVQLSWFLGSLPPSFVSTHTERIRNFGIHASHICNLQSVDKN